MYSVGLKVKDSDVRYAAKLLELDILALKVPTVEYSLGMREKIKMILFFLIKRDFFFLFDEPLSALDQKSLTISIDMMRESNKFVLMCTHSPTIAKGVMTGYANVLTHHKIIQQKGSTPDDQI
ncbi:AAA family ATPase [Lacticaseibacillus paracasei]|uniref:AAA family ATPase n=1 Tax=Lacticaseibacillus paracasei TaxID=1597 RepID=UPI000343CA51|nr:AAA family ATPase [Lacticaseibacillus paracasei]EPC33109.1 multidrug ABC transport system, ATPase component [Lacticaseibacillus paracasei subsp. paracasei Lpp120]MCO7164265.1 AAA family ATPase [Lacticaseibacillus paracasei]